MVFPNRQRNEPQRARSHYLGPPARQEESKTNSALTGGTIDPERKKTYIPFYFYIANTFALVYYLLNCRDMYISNTFSTSGEV